MQTVFIAWYFTGLFALGMLVALVMILAGPKPITAARAYETLVSQYLLFTVGVGFLVSFVTLAFFADQAQFHDAVANLGFSLVGFFAVRQATAVRFAALLGPAVYMWGSAVGDVVYVQTFSLPFLVLPIIGFVLLWLSAQHPHGRSGSITSVLDPSSTHAAA